MLELAKKPLPQLVELAEVDERQPQGGPLFDAHMKLIGSVKIRLGALLGSTTLTVGELSALQDGAVLQLDRALDDPVDIVLEGQVIARGRLVAVDDHFGVRITEVPAAEPKT